MSGLRHLVVVLGDQLDAGSAALDGFDPAQDAIWMCECREEATQVWSHQARIALFLAAMRHFAAAQRALGCRLIYRATGEHPHSGLIDALAHDLCELRPQALRLLEPGEYRLDQGIRQLAAHSGIPAQICTDRHFLCSRAEFAQWMGARKQPRMEHFYRWMRQRSGWLMQPDGAPAGGQWNFDQDNRERFPAQGPGLLRSPQAFAPDAITTEVLELVRREYGEHPGTLENFDWPVTRGQALQALEDFIEHRLVGFGRWQDAMWSGLAWPDSLLYHSRLSAALNLHLLDPREVCAAAIAGFESGRAPLAGVEGFVRQILGWREYVRGLYWHRMPQYLDDNALDAQQPLPAFYWNGATDYACLRQTLGETLRQGYAHHIQRLMVTGLFALLLGVRPRAVHEWYLAIYVDAVEWVELPNTLGMSQHADGGFMASKPYIASGKYLKRMGNYCEGCRFKPELATGERACPYTTLYWDFLDRHEERFGAHPRLKPQLLNLRRKSASEREAIRGQAAALRRSLA